MRWKFFCLISILSIPLIHMYINWPEDESWVTRRNVSILDSLSLKSFLLRLDLGLLRVVVGGCDRWNWRRNCDWRWGRTAATQVVARVLRCWVVVLIGWVRRSRRWRRSGGWSSWWVLVRMRRMAMVLSQDGQDFVLHKGPRDTWSKEWTPTSGRTINLSWTRVGRTGLRHLLLLPNRLSRTRKAELVTRHRRTLDKMRILEAF